MNKLWLLFKFELKNNIKQITGWAIALSFIIGIYMFLFDSIKEIGIAKLEGMPEELLQLLNIDSLLIMENYTLFFGTILGLLLIVASVYAGTFGVGLIRNEEKNKSIEYKATLNISKTQIYYSKLLVLITGIFIILININLVSIIMGYIKGGDTFILNDIIKISLYTSIVPLFFGLISMGISGISYKLGTGNVAGAIIAISYLGGYMTSFVEENIAEVLKYISPFIVFSTNDILKESSNMLVVYTTYLIISLVVAILGSYCYKNRDLNI